MAETTFENVKATGSVNLTESVDDGFYQIDKFRNGSLRNNPCGKTLAIANMLKSLPLRLKKHLKPTTDLSKTKARNKY